MGALALSLVAACGSVPDLRFGDDGNGDGGTGVSQDATIPIVADGSVAPGGDDSSSSSTGDDSSNTTNGDASDDGPPQSITDANGPPEAAPDPCPSHPPFGTTCCGAMQCRPNGFVPCDCNTCNAKCTGTQVCCIDKSSKFEQCAASIAACPKL